MSELSKRPEIVVFAGPNGSGKSTFTELLKPPIDYINADEIKKNLKCTDLEAAQLAEKQRKGIFYTLLLYIDSRSNDKCISCQIKSGVWRA